MDDADRAKTLEMAAREAALNRQRSRAMERDRPLIINGERCCRDCGDPIPAARLAARPESVRCLRCKEDKERRMKGVEY